MYRNSALSFYFRTLLSLPVHLTNKRLTLFRYQPTHQPAIPTTCTCTMPKSQIPHTNRTSRARPSSSSNSCFQASIASLDKSTVIPRPSRLLAVPGPGCSYLSAVRLRCWLWWPGIAAAMQLSALACWRARSTQTPPSSQTSSPS